MVGVGVEVEVQVVVVVVVWVGEWNKLYVCQNVKRKRSTGRRVGCKHFTQYARKRQEAYLPQCVWQEHRNISTLSHQHHTTALPSAGHVPT